MKLAKRFIALFVVAVMLISSCVIVNAATSTVTLTKNTTKTLSNSATYSTYSIYGSSSNKTASSYVLEFDPADGAIPMPYAAYGGANYPYFATHVNKAIENEGYKVIGAINGSFFTMGTANMCGINISGGRIIAADAACAGESMGVFTSNGKFTHVLTNLAYTVTVNDKTLIGGLASVNKRYSYVVGRNSSFANRFFYYDDYGKSGVKDTSIAGYEILCEKVDYTEIAPGQTLKGKVISVTESTYGASRPENKDRFILFMPKASTNVSYATGLKAGDSVSVTVDELNSGSKEAMYNAYSAISSCYALVKDGVDQTNSQSNIGTHSVTLSRAWTAFGVKADGSYVYFINEEYGLHLKDVAAAMMKMGCIHVYRLDGGGSSAMYNEQDGVVYLAEGGSNGRAVCDVLLVVAKESTYDANLTNQLKDTLAIAKTIAKPNQELKNNIASAEALLEETYPAKGDVKKLLSALSLKNILGDLVEKAKVESKDHYYTSDYELLTTAISNSEKILANDSATQAQYTNAITELSSALELSKYEVLSVGAKYTTTISNYKYQGTETLYDDQIRLVDGVKSTPDPFGATYSAWNKNIAGVGFIEVTVDLGKNTQSNTYNVYSASEHWGVGAATKIVVLGSTNGTSFTEIGTSTSLEKVGDGNLVDGTTITQLSRMSVSVDELQNYRYIKFQVYSDGPFLWLDEVEVSYNGALLPDQGGNVDGSVGDVNGDGKLNVTDYMFLKSIVLGNKNVTDLKDQSTAYARCDVKADGKINAADYFLLKKNLLA